MSLCARYSRTPALRADLVRPQFLLKSLQWLSVKYRIAVKIPSRAFRTIHGLAPAYVGEVIFVLLLLQNEPTLPQLSFLSQTNRVILKEMFPTKKRIFQYQQNLVTLVPVANLTSLFLYRRYLAGKVDLLTNEHRLVMIIHLLRGDRELLV